MDEERSFTKILAKIAEIVQSCPHFGDWDWCNEHCELYKFCDQIVDILDVTKVKRE